MSSWVVTALILNAALVVVAILFAVRIAGRTVVVAMKVELELSPGAVSTAVAGPDEASRLPLFSAAQMTRTEWLALLDAFDKARVLYVTELVKARTARASIDGSLTQATHDFEVAKRRLTRFELEVGSGPSNGRC